MADSASAPPHQPTVDELIKVCRHVADSFAKAKACVSDEFGQNNNNTSEVFIAHVFWWVAEVQKYLDEPPQPFDPTINVGAVQHSHEKVVVRMRQLGDLLEADPERKKGIAQLVWNFTQTMRNAVRISNAIKRGEETPEEYKTRLAATKQQPS